MSTLLEVQGLEAFYGRTKALHGVSFSMVKGGITTILGANGAGKTTTLRTISGLLRPRAGEVTFNGRSIAAMKPHLITAMRHPTYPGGHRMEDLGVLGSGQAPTGSG